MKKRAKKLRKKSSNYYMVYTDASFPLDENNVFLSSRKYSCPEHFQRENEEPDWKVLRQIKKVSDFEEMGGVAGVLKNAEGSEAQCVPR